jgi:hypothetical protein
MSPIRIGVVVRELSSSLRRVRQEKLWTETVLESRILAVLSNPNFAEASMSHPGSKLFAMSRLEASAIA